MPKKTKNLLHLKREYKKVYQYPLNWCPLWGYVPDFKETNLPKKENIFKIWDGCASIIEICRDDYFKVYFFNLYKYIALPDIKKIKVAGLLRDDYLISYFNETYPPRANEHEAIRRVFQNLDYITLKTSYNPRIIKLIKKVKLNENGIPQQTIGRANNKKQDVLGIIAGQINIDDEGSGSFDELLKEAQQIAGDNVTLNYQKYFSLLAVLEAWLVLTSLLHNPRQCAQQSALYKIQNKVTYAHYLMHIADNYQSSEDIEKLERPAQIGQRVISGGNRGGWHEHLNRQEKEEAQKKKWEEAINIGREIAAKNRNISFTEIAKRTSQKTKISKSTLRQKNIFKKAIEQFRSEENPPSDNIPPILS